MSTNSKRPGMWRVPNWLVVAVVIASLGGGVAGIGWWVKRDTHGVDEMVVDASQRGGRPRFQGRQGEGIMKGMDSVLMARAGGIQVRLDKNDFKVMPAMGGGGIT
ncbi:MAG: hypothetical protein ACM359_11215, partial [Bacillota bacterium]